jgi:hypothetical protein
MGRRPELRNERAGAADASGHHGAAAQLSHPGEELAVERLFLGLDDHVYRAPAHGPGLRKHGSRVIPAALAANDGVPGMRNGAGG